MHGVFLFSWFLSYTLLLIDLGLIAYLSLHAYRDADTLDRFVVSSHSFTSSPQRLMEGLRSS